MANQLVDADISSSDGSDGWLPHELTPAYNYESDPEPTASTTWFSAFAGYEEVIHPPKPSGRANGWSLPFGPHWVSSTHLLVLRVLGDGFQGFRGAERER